MAHGVRVAFALYSFRKSSRHVDADPPVFKSSLMVFLLTTV